MKIQYLGHTCFLLTESTGTSIVTDPHGDIARRLPAVSADVVTVSQPNRKNIGIVGGNPRIIDKEGRYAFEGVEITGIRSFHDDEGGALRGENLIFKFRMDGLDVCHLGEIGESCTAELLEQIQPIHVLLIPVGRKYNIDGEQAKEYVDRIMPSVVVPMHYRSKGVKTDIERPDGFLDCFEEDEVSYAESDTLEFFRDDLSGESTKVILMERINGRVR